MSKSNARSVLDGKPYTRETKDSNGNTTITVNVKALSAIGARLADYATIGVTGAVTIACISGGIIIEDASLMQRLVMCALPIPAFFLVKRCFYSAFAKTKPVVFTPETTTYSRFLRTLSFDSGFPIKFVLHTHPKADIEANKMQLRETKRKVKWYTRPLKPYYQNSYLLVLEYMGQPNVIMTIYTRQKAQEVVAKLTAVSEIIRSYGSSGGGTATTPAADWAKQAGGVTIDHERSVS